MRAIEQQNNGSTAIELLVVVLIVAFCSLTLFMIKKADHLKVATGSLTTAKNTSKLTATSEVPPQGTPPVKVITPNTSSSQSTQSSTQLQYNIASIGINITVPSSMSDLTYSSTTAANGTITVNFSTQSVTNDAPSCAATVGQGAFDSIIRANGSYPTDPTSNEGLIKQQPGFYIAYVLPTGPCTTGASPSVQSLLDQQQEEFYSAISTVQIAI